MGCCQSTESALIGNIDQCLYNYHQLAYYDNENQFGGQVSYYQHNDILSKRAIKKEMVTSDELYYHFIKSQVQFRKKLRNNNICQVLGLNEQKVNQCSVTYAVQILLEKSSVNLYQEVESRKDSFSTFSERELLIMLCELVYALNYFIENSIQHRNIRMDQIFICKKDEFSYNTQTSTNSNQQTFIKLQDPLLFHPQNNQTSVLTYPLQSQKYIYLAPSQLQDIEARVTKNINNPYKSDLFSIGMCILSCALLEDMGQCYDYENLYFKEKVFNEKLAKLENQYFSPQFISILKEMLQLEERIRIDPRRLKEKLFNFASPYLIPPVINSRISYINTSQHSPIENVKRTVHHHHHHYEQTSVHNSTTNLEQLKHGSAKKDKSIILDQSFQKERNLSTSQMLNKSFDQNQQQKPSYYNSFRADSNYMLAAQMNSNNNLNKSVNQSDNKQYNAFETQYVPNNNFAPSHINNNFQNHNGIHQQQLQSPNSQSQLLLLPGLNGKGRTYKIGTHVYEIDQQRTQVRYSEQTAPFERTKEYSQLIVNESTQQSPLRQSTYTKNSNIFTTQNGRGSFVQNSDMRKSSHLQKVTNSSNQIVSRTDLDKQMNSGSKNFQQKDLELVKVSETYEDGSKYEGQKSYGKRQGYGVFQYPQGGRYEGSWNNNELHGQGMLYGQNEALIYKGNFAHGKFEGHGMLYNEDCYDFDHNDLAYRNFNNVQSWQKYEGQFSNDEKNGKGILFFLNGEKFDGTFLNGLPHGNGVYHRQYLSPIRGIWQNGILQKEFL